MASKGSEDSAGGDALLFKSKKSLYRQVCLLILSES